MAWLGTWGSRRKLTIDSSKIDALVSGFPIAVPISSAAGLGATDLTDIFSTMAFTGDDFTGTDGDPPNPKIWTETDTSNLLSIQGNVLKFDATSIVSGEVFSLMYSTFKFSADFDVQVDFTTDELTMPPSQQYCPMFGIFNITHTINYAWVGRVRNASLDRYGAYGRDYTAGSYIEPAATSGKLRFTRVSGEIRAFRWETDKWAWNGSTAGFKCTNATANVDVHLRFYWEQESGEDVRGTISNFVINSGTPIFTGLNFPNRKKVAVTTSDGTTQCKVEIENFDPANSNALLHVNAPSILSSADTDLYLYYDASQPDNDTYVGDTGDTPAQDVWDSDFKGVWHMAQDPSAGASSIKDSTSNANHGSPASAMVAGDIIAGPVSGSRAIDLDGTPQYLNMGNGVSLDIVEKLTLETVGKRDSATTSPMLCARDIDPGFRNYFLYLNGTTDAILFGVFGSTVLYYSSSANSSIGIAWQHMAGVYDKIDVRTYVDGALNGSPTAYTGNIDNTDVPFTVGGRSTPDTYMTGSVSEVRVSATDRPAAWIKATKHSLFDELLTWSAVELYVAGPEPEPEPEPAVVVRLGNVLFGSKFVSVKAASLVLSEKLFSVKAIKVIRNGKWIGLS